MRGIEHLVDAVYETDVFIVGAEGAGARAAIESADQGASVLVATKGAIGKSGATLTADADIDVDSRSCRDLFGLPGDRDDSPEKFMEDMIIEGEYLGNQRLIEIHCSEAPFRTKQLVDWGAKIDKLTHAPGHRYPRGIWIPGSEFARVLPKEIAKRRIELKEHFMVTDLLLTDGQVSGAVGLDILTGSIVLIRCKAVILCTGGAMRIWPHTTAPDELTGDGMAMAYRVGAELVDMEFPMFLPYCLISPSAVDGVDFSYLISAYVEAYALNRLGERYMSRWDPVRMERTTRDVNSIAAGVEILEGRGSPGGGTYLSLKHLPDNLVSFTAQWFPKSFANWRYGAFNMRDFIPDLTREAMETAPATHFWNGGVKINEQCETNIPGLYAAGEGTGSIHGANRVSGNALTMTQVWGPRAGMFAAKYASSNSLLPVREDDVAMLCDRMLSSLRRSSGTNAIELRHKIRSLAADKVGVVRDAEGLRDAIDQLPQLREECENTALVYKEKTYNLEWIEALQNQNMLDVLEMVARASLLRTESRGALFRRDHRKTNNVDWVKNVILTKADTQMSSRLEAAIITTLEPQREIRDYGAKE